VSPFVEPPPPPSALSGEPILSNVPRMSPPPHRVALAAIPDPPQQRQTSKSGRPLPPLLRAPTLPCLRVGRATPPASQPLRHGPRAIASLWATPDSMPAGRVALC
jgi:hypothetical protein